MALLLEIHQEYIKRLAVAQSRQPLFKGRWMVLEFVRYLQRVPQHFSGLCFDCAEPCPEGNCPPCLGWKRSQYEQYLAALRQRNAADLARSA